jgi:hypothetical protein
MAKLSRFRRFIRDTPVVLTEFHFFVWSIAATILVIYEAGKFLWKQFH